MTSGEIRTTLAARIKSLRENRNMTQADLAFDSDISVPFLSDIERGNKWPSPETISKISSTLNVEPFELFIPVGSKNDTEKILAANVIQEILLAQQNIANKIYKDCFESEP